ncbi:hypothetical protein CVT25_002240, partial [Psilocybe cyanescens]
TVIRYVSSPRHNPLYRLKAIQGLLPLNDDRPYAQLDALYINILSEVGDIKAVLQTLGVAILLTKNEDIFIQYLVVYYLEKFMQLSPGTLPLLLVDLLSIVDASDNREPIKFLHASFPDFLIDPTRSRQFFIDPSKMHETAAHFCILAIESLDMATPLPGLAYGTLLKHLRLAGPLHDNTALREKISSVPYVQHWTTFVLTFRGDSSSLNYLVGDPGMFLEFLQTSEFSEPEELYLHHRGIFDQRLRTSLALIPLSPHLTFWSAVSASRILESNKYVSLGTIFALSDALAADVPASVPGFLFSALFNQIELRSEWVQPPWFSLCHITGTPYLRMVTEFLNDPLRAGPHTVDQSMYTAAAVFVVEFAVKAWNSTKHVPRYLYEHTHWDFIWDAFPFVLSKAGYSAELVNTLGKPNLTFNLETPDTNVHHRVQTLFGAVRNYLLKFKGSSPSPFKIIIDCTPYPTDSSDYVINRFTAADLTDYQGQWRVFYVDESILPSDVDTQGSARQ